MNAEPQRPASPNLLVCITIAVVVGVIATVLTGYMLTSMARGVILTAIPSSPTEASYKAAKEKLDSEFAIEQQRRILDIQKAVIQQCTAKGGVSEIAGNGVVCKKWDPK